MRTAAELVTALADSLARVYPARVALLSKPPGRLSVTVTPVRATYESSVCPGPLTLEVDVHVLAAGSDEQAVKDMLTHLGPIADLIREVGFTTSAWTSGTVEGRPETVISAVADGIG